MILKSIQLTDFRSHQKLHIDFDANLTLIEGTNGSGKTSVIEALNLVSSGSSFRAGRVEEMIAFDQELAKVELETDEDTLTIMLTRGFLQGKRTPYKHYLVNGVKKRFSAVVGKFRAVVFRPEDLRLVEGPPSRRRSFLNDVISSISPDFARSLTAYERTLIRRNKLLQAVREAEQPRTSLQYWNMSLLKHGELLQIERRRFLDFCNQVDFPVTFRTYYLPSIISEDRQIEYLEREIAAGHSLIGPHKDDFLVEADVTNLHRGDLTQLHDIAAYGSRGQQRLAVLWLKTCQIRYIEQKFDERPVLLLDDIFSELDADSRQVVNQLLQTHQSVLTTAADDIELNLSITCSKFQL